MSSRTLRPLSLALAALLAGCATQKAAEKGDAKTEAAPERVALTNQSPFDIAACGPRALTVPLAAESLTGALLVAQPAFMECLVDPKARGPEAQTHAHVQATVSETGVAYEVTGANLLEPGKACIVAAAKKLAVGATAKGDKPVVAAIEFVHVSGVSPTVKFGVNVASDVVGTLRLAQPDFCECYVPLAHQPPPTLKMTLKLTADKAPDIAMDPVTEKPAQTISDCVAKKTAALTLPKVTSELQIPYPFALVDSFTDQETAGVPTGLQFAQLDAIRGQRNADVGLALGARSLASLAYDGVVQKYKMKPTPSLIPELKDRCKAVIDADNAWLASLTALVAANQRLVTFTQDLSLKDIQWAEAASGSQAQLVKAQGDRSKVELQIQADQAACPKSK